MGAPKRSVAHAEPFPMTASRLYFPPAAATSTPLPAYALVLVLLLAVFFALNSLGGRKLANPDEGRYSEIAREMAESGDFVTPRLNGLKYFEKPPLQYWATAISFRLFGQSEFTARLYTALCGLGCILLIAFVGWRLYDITVATLAAVFLMSSPYFAALTEIVTLDMGLTFWMTLSLAGFLLGEHAGTPRERRRWLIVAWAGAAGAVLSKGLIGVVFPAATVFLYCLFKRDFGLLKRLEWGWGLAVFFLLTAPWFVLVSRDNPEFARFFFIHEHFERFLSDAHRRTEAWWFFFPILFAGVLPWALALIPAVLYGWRKPGQTTFGIADSTAFRPLQFMLVFCAFVLLFFTKSNSKLPAYILPMFPPLALVVAVYLRNVDAKKMAWMIAPIALVAGYGAYAAWLAPAKRGKDEFSRVLYGEMSIWVVAAAIAIATAAAIAFVLLRMRHKWCATFLFAICTVIGIELIEVGYEKISPLQSGHAVAEVIKAKMTPDTRLYVIKHYDQSLPFYLSRTLTMVEYVDEFEMGQQQEPHKYIPSIRDLPAYWNAPGPAIALIQPYGADELRALGMNFEVIHNDPRRAAIYKKQ
jgi:4-amino-4-deoxy-L-arabinose transferase-like glycosyltransferase